MKPLVSGGGRLDESGAGPVLGAGFDALRTTPGGQIAIRGRGAWRGAPSGEIAALLSEGAWSGWAQAAGDTAGLGLLTAGLAWDPGPVRLEAAGVTAGGIVQTRGGVGWTLPGPLSVLRLRAGANRDWTGSGWISREAEIRYTHPTGCVSIAVLGRMDADRALPELRLDLDVSANPDRGSDARP